jgi:hypothetical protein
MSPLIITNLLLLPVLVSFFTGTLSSPAAYPNQYVEHALKKRQSLNIVQTTNTHAQIIDWIPIESQGKIAKAPPLPHTPPTDASKKAGRPISELEMPGVQKGPPGTVPIPRVNATYLARAHQKQPPPKKTGVSKRQDAGVHWYVSSNQDVSNNGGNWVMVSSSDIQSFSQKSQRTNLGLEHV